MVDFALTFPAGFLWGTATSAYQVEGGNTNNNWYAWEQELGRIFEDQRAGPACDWWGGRYVEDFDRAAALHQNAHRFSVEWSRVEPERGKFSSTALDHYAAMIEALRARHMEPMVTLHHFTEPLWIAQTGGWLNPETARRFERFVRLVVEELGAGVRLWCTINEPQVYASLGYLIGRFPPGHRSLGQMQRVLENLLRAHAGSYHSIKTLYPAAQVGFANHQISLAARRPAWLHGIARRAIQQSFNGVFLDALLDGVLRFPLRAIKVPQARDTFDWVGLNYYYRFLAGLDLRAARQAFIRQSRPREGLLGPESVGEIWPEGLFDHIKWLAGRTDRPIYITENGLPDGDDTHRPLHLVRSLRSVWSAINYNYPVKGYFYWTLVDNFEWAEGYDPRFRFGLLAHDPATQARTPRASAALYGEVCAANALTGAAVRQYAPAVMDSLFPGVPVQREVVLPARQ